MSEEEDELPDLGTCCGCDKVGPDVRNVMMLDREAPPMTTGWGCFVCSLPTIGAVAILCDKCLADDVAPKFVVSGRIKTKGRQNVLQYPLKPFGHDLSQHPELRGKEKGHDVAP